MRLREQRAAGIVLSEVESTADVGIVLSEVERTADVGDLAERG